jgi:curli biogenesis system outer membrane secretion channel CsgG
MGKWVCAFLQAKRRTIPVPALLFLLILSSCVSADPVVKDVEPPRDTPGRSFGAGVPIAVFDFEVRSSVPGYEALSSDVSAALIEAFIAGGVVKPLERAALEKVLGELELSMGGLVDPGTAAKVGKLAGARFVLLGTAAVVGKKIRLSCRIVDVETAEIVYAKSAYGESKDIFKIEIDLAALVEKDFSS